MREAYFHEDDYRQIEVLPLDNFGYCQQEIGEIEKSSAENFDGYGFKDIYVREENPSHLGAMNIRVSEIEEALEKILPKFDVVYTGYSSYKEKCKGLNAFGRDQGERIFFEHNEGIVTSIWVSDPFNELIDLPHSEKLLFVDWAWGFVCPLKEKEHFIEYIKDRDTQIEESLEKMRALHPQKSAKKPRWKFW